MLLQEADFSKIETGITGCTSRLQRRMILGWQAEAHSSGQHQRQKDQKIVEFLKTYLTLLSS